MYLDLPLYLFSNQLVLTETDGRSNFNNYGKAFKLEWRRSPFKVSWGKLMMW
jgi:hypothetical protein